MPPGGLFMLGEAHKGWATAIKADLRQVHPQAQKEAYLGLILMAACSSPAGSLAIQRVQPQIRMTPLGDRARSSEGNTRDIGKRKLTITDLHACR